MALVNDKIKVTTIEKDTERYLIALKNIKDFELEKRIALISGDALDIELDDLKLVARALLPDGIAEGSKLKYEMLQYELMD